MKEIILVGNPNTGKTTLFNTITNSHEHVGNWHGVTVGEKVGKFKYCGNEYKLVDLPGLYSLDAYSGEEKIAYDYLMQNKKMLVINICDANNLERNLLLTLQLKSIGANVILAVNMAKENKNIDYKKLSNELGMKVVPIDARKKKSVENLLSVAESIGKDLGDKQKQDLCTVDRVENAFKKINHIMAKVYIQTPEQNSLGIIDKIVLNPILFIPIFVIIIGFVFYITFGPVGAFLSGNMALMSDIISGIVLDFVENSLGKGLIYGLLSNAIFGGVSTVLEFLPQVALLFFCLGFLEDVGYLPRVAYMLDGLLKKVGLTGRSLFSLLMGFGCTTTAMMTTRNMDNSELKKRTAFVLPFMSCSAKLPIFLVMISAFFSEYKVLILLGLYLLGILVAIISSSIMNKISKNNHKNNFIMELPKYRFPSIKKLLGDTAQSAKHFLTKVGSVILLSSIVIWMLMSFSGNFEYLGGESVSPDSILANVANFIYPVFKPLGFTSPFVVVALLAGIVGKEMVVSTIGILNGVEALGISVAESICLASSPINFSFASAISFALFVLLYPPCESALVVAKREVGTGFMFKSLCFQLSIAYIVALIGYQVCKNPRVLYGICFVIIVAIITYLVIKSKRKQKCGICEGCNDNNRVCRRTEKT